MAFQDDEHHEERDEIEVEGEYRTECTCERKHPAADGGPFDQQRVRLNEERRAVDDLGEHVEQDDAREHPQPVRPIGSRSGPPRSEHLREDEPVDSQKHQRIKQESSPHRRAIHDTAGRSGVGPISRRVGVASTTVASGPGVQPAQHSREVLSGARDREHPVKSIRVGLLSDRLGESSRTRLRRSPSSASCSQ